MIRAKKARQGGRGRKVIERVCVCGCVYVGKKGGEREKEKKKKGERDNGEGEGGCVGKVKRKKRMSEKKTARNMK